MLYAGLKDKHQRSFRNTKTVDMEYIHDLVCKHFKVDTLAIKTRKRELVTMRNLFCYLYFETRSKVEGRGLKLQLGKIFIDLSNLLEKDRTTFNHIYGKYKDDFWRKEKFIIEGDYFCNHFYELLGEIESKDYSGNKISYDVSKQQPILDIYTTRINENYDDIKRDLKKGLSLKFINKKYIKAIGDGNLTSRLNKLHPELINIYKGSKSYFGEKQNKVLEYYSEIEEMLSKGANFVDVNDRYNIYTDSNSLSQSLKAHFPELHKVFRDFHAG